MNTSTTTDVIVGVILAFVMFATAMITNTIPLLLLSVITALASILHLFAMRKLEKYS